MDSVAKRASLAKEINRALGQVEVTVVDSDNAADIPSLVLSAPAFSIDPYIWADRYRQQLRELQIQTIMAVAHEEGK